MPRAAFTSADFLAVARAVALAGGPAAITVAAVAGRLRAPVGSFYHRFGSRDSLAGELWLALVLDFQAGFLAAADAGDWLGAALHVAAWSRANPAEARLLLGHRKEDFVGGEWPEGLRERVAGQAGAVEARVARLAAEVLGGVDPDRLRRAAFVLVEAPLAAVRPHLLRGEAPPAVADALIRETFTALARPAPPRR